MDAETTNALRSMIRRVNMKNIKDDGQKQTASIEVADGIWRDDVEIEQPYGLASSVPEDGAIGIAFAIGGDEGNVTVLPIGNPSQRMGGLNPNEVGMYNASGDKMVMLAGGVLDIKTGAHINITTDTGVHIVAQIVSVDGDIEATGDISDKNGSMQEMRETYNEHGHPDAVAPPNPLQD